MRDTDLKRRRDRALYRAYVKVIEAHDVSSLRQAADIARRQTAPEYFLSSREASLLIGKIQSFVSLADIHTHSRGRIWEIYSKYLDHLSDNPGCTATRENVLDEIVEKTASCFFMGVEMARKIILRERRRRRKEWQERLR